MCIRDRYTSIGGLKLNYHVELPITDSSECFEIRLESIGGLGANLCGKLLGELGALYLGLNSASFSSYGSEKRGSPVKSYIRWCKADREPVSYTHLPPLKESLLNQDTVHFLCS